MVYSMASKEKIAQLSGTNIKSVSFKFFHEKYKPAKAIRTSLHDYKQKQWMKNIPLFAFLSQQ